MLHRARGPERRIVLGAVAAGAAILLAAVPARAQSASCMETGLGLYRGWRSLSYSERTRRCVDAEQRSYDRLQWLREREALRREHGLTDYERQRLREQECLMNAAACDIPSVPLAPPEPPPPPPPPPPPMR